ncbi:MAG: hypothetical protein KDK64_07245 [Chlamydiia bacterium]|nr:hypothetical protein [Chlamydiia bacterium]
MKRQFTIISLILSTGTWFCCVLPAMVTAIAGAAAVSTLISSMPWLVTIGKYKDWIFSIVGVLLIVNFCLLYISAFKKECPIEKKEACQTTKNWSKILFWISVGVYLIGLFVAYALLPLSVLLCEKGLGYS